MTTCQPSGAIFAAMVARSSLGAVSTRRLRKLNRTPRTPASSSRRSSASVTSGRTVAIPRARPPAASTASTMALLSAPWQVAWTMTLRLMPRWSRSAKSCSLLASQGVYLRSGANGKRRPGAEDVAVGVDRSRRQRERRPGRRGVPVQPAGRRSGGAHGVLPSSVSVRGELPRSPGSAQGLSTISYAFSVLGSPRELRGRVRRRARGGRRRSARRDRRRRVRPQPAPGRSRPVRAVRGQPRRASAPRSSSSARRASWNACRTGAPGCGRSR